MGRVKSDVERIKVTVR